MENLDKLKPVDEGPKTTVKKSQGQQYKLEKERIKYEIGDLEQIRLSLGYSQRRMCLLLLVDPSAWTRWTKSLSGAPPHIYKALQWLVELKKANPEAAAPTNLAKRLDYVQSSTDSQIKALESEISSLERSLQRIPTSQPNFDFESALRLQESRWALAFATLEKELKAAVVHKKSKHKKKLKKKPKLKLKKLRVVLTRPKTKLKPKTMRQKKNGPKKKLKARKRSGR